LETARKAQEASEAKSRLLTRVNHDLRTPVGAITGFCELLERSDLAPSQREMVVGARDAAKTLLGLIDDLLDMSRLQSGEVRLSARPFVLTDLLTRIMKMLTPAAEGKGLRLHLYVGPTTPTKLEGDTLRISQVLLNLAGNAIKFTDSGYVSMGVESRTFGDSEAWLRFEVADTGIGIPPEFQAKIFEDFTQVDPGSTGRYGGSGLGLSIAK
jgi:signal transduction histidine kinase